MKVEFDPTYYSGDELITRNQIAELTGVSISKVKTIISSQFLDFPLPLGKIDREFVYFKTDVLAWLETHDIHEDLLKDSNRKSTLSNELAQEFLTQKYKNPN